MPKSFWEVAKNNIDNIVMPLEKMPEMGVLIDVSSFSNNEITPNQNGEVQIIKSIENVLEECFEINLISDATICTNENQKRAFGLLEKQLLNLKKRA